MPLKKSEEGFTNPLGSPAYFPPPYPFRNAETVFIEYELSKEQVEAELPEPFEYVGSPAFAIIQDAQLASGAPFHEGYIFLPARYKGVVGYYAPYVFGCPEEAVLANRELYGWPEMIADYPHPKIKKDGHTVVATVQRRGEVLIDAKLTLERRAPAEELPAMDDNFTIKKIPSPLANGKPLRQLIHIRLQDVEIRDVWSGRGELTLGASSQFKISRLRPAEITRSFYFVMSWNLPHAVAAWDV